MTTIQVHAAWRTTIGEQPESNKRRKLISFLCGQNCVLEETPGVNKSKILQIDFWGHHPYRGQGFIGVKYHFVGEFELEAKLSTFGGFFGGVIIIHIIHIIILIY